MIVTVGAVVSYVTVLSVVVLAALALPAASWATPAAMLAMTVPVAGHPTDGHVVGGATARHGRRGCPGGAGEGHIAGGEVRDGFTEHHGEVDRRSIGRIKLTGGLVDGDRRGGGIVRDGIIRGCGGGVGVAGRIVGHACGNTGNDRAAAGHPADGHVVGGAAAGHGGRGCAGACR